MNLGREVLLGALAQVHLERGDPVGSEGARG